MVWYKNVDSDNDIREESNVKVDGNIPKQDSKEEMFIKYALKSVFNNSCGSAVGYSHSNRLME